MDTYIADFIDFVTASPSSFHAADEVQRRLIDAGFKSQNETEDWDASPGGHVMVRDGAVMAWWVPADASEDSAFRVVGSHTDSPGFKVKPDPTYGAAGFQQVGVEVYGGVLLNSWLDRELGVAGRVMIKDGRQLLASTGPVMRIPQLAIHMDRKANEGLTLDRQTHTAPVIAVGLPGSSILDAVAEDAGIAADDIIGHDLISFDTQVPRTFGIADQFLASGRLDNLASVYASLVALLEAVDHLESEGHSTDILVLAAFDHEEVGSATRSGAQGPILEDVLTRTAGALGASAENYAQMLARSSVVSADGGHSVHPNYTEKHDPVAQPVLGAGPVLKINANQRYATDAVGAALWARACQAANVPTQTFVSNNRQPCGSTIGPATSVRLGMTTVDVGISMLSMHSAREMAHVEDLSTFARALGAYYIGA